jgi:hypothetical protein
MSTRCNIIITDGEDQLIFYRHSDGYPEGALPTLKKFMQWVKEGKIRDNVEQSAGWLILIGAKEYDSVYIGGGKRELKQTLTEPNSSDTFSGWQCGAYEPATSIHGDIEWLYTLNLSKLTITVQEVIDNEYEKYGKSGVITDFTVEPEPVYVVEQPEIDPDALEIL